MKRLEWTGCIFTIIGVFIFNSNIGLEYIALIAFLISNVALITFSINKKLSGLLTMNVVLLLINVFGVYRWIIEPFLQI